MAGVGGKREGAGRKAGVPNKATLKRQAEIEATGITPLDLLVSTLRDTSLQLDVRLDAAKAAAPYVHPRLSNVEATVKGELRVTEIRETIVDPRS